MVAGAHRDAVAVEDRADVVRVHALDDERHDARLVPRRTDDAHARDLGDALAGCHWYIISARPAVRIVPGSVGLGEGILTVAFRESGIDGASESVSVHGAAYADDDHDAAFRIHQDGSYFSFQFPGAHLHGDSWSLAAFLSGGGPALARHEILYIGKAYGDGYRLSGHGDRKFVEVEKGVLAEAKSRHETISFGLAHFGGSREKQKVILSVELSYDQFYLLRKP